MSRSPATRQKPRPEPLGTLSGHSERGQSPGFSARGSLIRLLAALVLPTSQPTHSGTPRSGTPHQVHHTTRSTTPTSLVHPLRYTTVHHTNISCTALSRWAGSPVDPRGLGAPDFRPPFPRNRLTVNSTRTRLLVRYLIRSAGGLNHLRPIRPASVELATFKP